MNQGGPYNTGGGQAPQMSHTYYRRRLRANKMKRRIIAGRNCLRNFRALLRVGMIFLIMFFGIWVLKLPQWHISAKALAQADPSVVQIEGNVITPTYKIIDMVRQTQLPDVAVYRLKTKTLEKNIAQLEPIKKVNVRRFWFPGRLIISVEECIPAFVIAPNLEAEPISTVTQEGVFIGRDYMPLDKKFNVTKILSYGVRGDDYEKWPKERIDELLKFVKTMEAYSKQKVLYIDLRNPQDVYVQLESVLVRFGEINDTAFKRAQWIATILPEAQKFPQKVKYIDLRWEDAHYIKLGTGTNNEKPKSQEITRQRMVPIEQSKPEEQPAQDASPIR